MVVAPMTDGEEFLAKFDLARSRTPEELQHLVDTIGDRLCGSLALRKVARSGKGLWKKYNEEIRPLALLLVGTRDVLCMPNLLEGKNYDALIRVSSGSNDEELLIEFTCAKDRKSGREDSIRMQVLNDTGRVNQLGRLTWQGKKTNRRIHVEEETALKEHTLGRLRCSAIERIEKKAQKDYRSTHVLVVTFDDYAVWSDELERLRSDVQSEVALPALPFGAFTFLAHLAQLCALCAKHPPSLVPRIQDARPLAG